MKKLRFGLLFSLFCLLSVFLVTSVGGASYSTTFPKAKNRAEKDLLTIDEATVDTEDGAVLLRFSFAVDSEALAEIEEYSKVTFGALVARAANGYGKNTLELVYDEANDAYRAPERARMLTVYSTDGARHVNASFSSDALDTFTVTVDLETKTVERTESDIVCLGFLLIEEEGSTEDARVLYVARNGSPYGSSPSYAGIVRENYLSDKENDETMNEYIKLLQSQVKSDVDVLSNARVFFCGEDTESDLFPGERAIWVQYLPERDPYPNDSDPDKRGIRAAYLYYPIDFDPMDLSSSELLERGALRVFAYIGAPARKVDVPGLVCVHGGGGHAYAQYALEAVKQGYAAIAFDTEGCHNLTGRGSGSYSDAESAYPKDTVSHKGKDSFENAESALTEQWLYYAVSDTVLANTVLRALPEVNESKVGITGISWGGLITSTAICYDYRFAFAVPVYISFHMSESYGVSLANINEKPFADALWQDASLLAASPVPTLIVSSEKDLFASIDTVSKSASDLPNGTMTVKPNLIHGQQQGAALPEIYHFGYYILGQNGGFVTAKTAPTASLGNSYTLALDIPADVENVRATLYYRTAPLYKYGDSTKPEFLAVPLTVSADGSVSVEIPEGTRMYFISFAAYNKDADLRKEGTPYIYADQYKQGDLYSSTDIVYLP